MVCPSSAWTSRPLIVTVTGVVPGTTGQMGA